MKNKKRKKLQAYAFNGFFEARNYTHGSSDSGLYMKYFLLFKSCVPVKKAGLKK